MRSLQYLTFIGFLLPAVALAQLGKLKVSENRRFLVQENGQPFFYLGDTAWELFHRLTREEAERFLKNRADKKYTVIQAVALAELDGLNAPNAYGHRPLKDNNPTTPDTQPGAENDYWDQVDFVVDKANALGLRIGFLPTWGDKWNKKGGAGPEIFTPENAAVYGEWLGQRYRDKALLWILGGDRNVESEQHKDITRAMAKGLRKGDGGTHLLTFHPTGGRSSAEWFHDEDWLDFNMRQNGHEPNFTSRYQATRQDHDRAPFKPVIDGEPLYEDHPLSFKAKEFGISVAADVRRPLYWNLFTGAFGHTYGHHSVWQMWAPGRPPINNPVMPWFEAIDQPGADQMRHGRALIESRPFLTRVPDDTIIVADAVATAVPGEGQKRFVATRDTEGTYAMIYVPTGRGFKVRMDVIKQGPVKAWWFNPRNGLAKEIGEFANQGERAFLSPDPGETLDWVLVLDAAAKQYPAPGTSH